MNMKTETMGSITGNLASELSNGRPNVRSVVLVALAVWFGLVFFLASQGAFVGSVGSPPLPIFFGVAIPLALFFALLRIEVVPGFYPRRRPSIRGCDRSLSVWRLWFPLAVTNRYFAWV